MNITHKNILLPSPVGEGQGVRLVCLDDDPTGIQTVHGCLLLTEWSEASIDVAFRDEVPFFYILTNTRAMTREQAAAVTREAMRNVLKVNEKYGFKLIFVSRSDSCLRGHFPLETDVMHEVISSSVGADLVSARPYDGSDKSVRLVAAGGHKVRPYGGTLTFFCPAFIEAGRFTKDGVHYLRDGERVIPVHESEFARDNVFAYHHSNLRNYIAEKLGHENFQYHLLGLNDFQTLYPEEKTAYLANLIPSPQPGGAGGGLDLFIAVDATEYSHLYAFAESLLEWMKDKDEPVVIRSSSSLPKAISGIEDKQLLTKEELLGRADTRSAPTGNDSVQCSTIGSPSPIFIVGSHVKKTTQQLEKLLECEGTVGIELDVERILYEPEKLWEELRERLVAINSENNRQLRLPKHPKQLRQPKTPIIYTSRKELRLDDPDKRQRLGQTVSDFLVSIVRRLPYRPSCVIAKGGITSHDILTHGLQVKTARVMGQILNAVPCIKTGEDSTFPHLPYVIFPGNVGTETALAEVYQKLS